MTAKVEDYYGFVIRRLAAAGTLPARLPRRGPAVAAGRVATAGVRIDAPAALGAADDEPARAGRPARSAARRPSVASLATCGACRPEIATIQAL